MSNRHELTGKLVFRLAWPAVAALLAILIAMPALAQPPTGTPAVTGQPAAGALTITAVQPGTLINDSEVEIIITGAGFVDGTVVVIDNFGGLQTAFVSANVLRAIVPPGLPAGQYSVRVVNPDATTAEATNALRIVLPVGPTATPEPSSTPAPTAFVRPLLVVSSYGASAPMPDRRRPPTSWPRSPVAISSPATPAACALWATWPPARRPASGSRSSPQPTCAGARRPC